MAFLFFFSFWLSSLLVALELEPLPDFARFFLSFSFLCLLFLSFVAFFVCFLPFLSFLLFFFLDLLSSELLALPLFCVPVLELAASSGLEATRLHFRPFSALGRRSPWCRKQPMRPAAR